MQLIMKKILCIGSVTTDLILSPVEALPEPGVLKSIDGFSMHVGGCASNAAIDLAKLGIPASLCCKVGQDVFGDFILKETRKAGVDTTPVITDPAVFTTVSTVLVRPDGERSFLYHKGSTSALREDEISDRLLDACDIVFVAGAMLLSSLDGEPCARLLQRAHALGKYTVMDTAYDFDGLWLEKVKAVIPELDLFMPSEVEAQNITGMSDPDQMADSLFRLGARNVIIKLGSRGALICPAESPRFFSPAFRVTPVDTTGAGDSFCAGFLAGLSLGRSFRESAVLANAVGAHCVKRIGATTGIPSLEEIEAFIQNHQKQEADL